MLPVIESLPPLNLLVDPNIKTVADHKTSSSAISLLERGVGGIGEGYLCEGVGKSS